MGKRLAILSLCLLLCSIFLCYVDVYITLVKKKVGLPKNRLVCTLSKLQGMKPVISYALTVQQHICCKTMKKHNARCHCLAMLSIAR